MSAALIAGCANVKKSANKQPANQLALSANQYLKLATNTTGKKKDQYRLLAAKRLIQDKKTGEAQKVLDAISKQDVSPTLQVEKQLTQAQLCLLNHNADQALTLLNTASASNVILSIFDQIQLHKLLAITHQEQNDILGTIKERNMSYDLLSSPEEKQNNLLVTWEILQNVDVHKLQQLLEQPLTPIQQGWISLALLSNPYISSQELLDKIAIWQQQNPNHPAENLLDTIKKSKRVLPQMPKKIALLLPLDGPLANQSKAIRNGFFAAYYQAKTKGPTPNIKVYNTSKGNIEQTYKAAVSAGASFIVGPLKKKNLLTLVKQNDISVPTLALNDVPNDQFIKHLYQFGLSPIDEANQAAKRIWDNQAKRIAIITPNDPWSKNIANQFQQTWTALGGTMITQLTYSHSRQSLDRNIRSLLNIDQSQQRRHQLRWLLKEKIRSFPRRRNDIDAIFLMATPTMGRQILPLLRFYYAGNIPVYSISQIYSGQPKPKLDHDLNGVIFDGMPWLLNPGDSLSPSMLSLRAHMKSLWPQAFANQSRFFALGLDSYNLIPELGKLTVLPKFGLNGATGTLYLLPNQHIYRKLLWATMAKGQPLLLPS